MGNATGPPDTVFGHLRIVFPLLSVHTGDRPVLYVRVNLGRLSYVLSNNSGKKMNFVHQHHYNLWFQTSLTQHFEVLWP